MKLIVGLGNPETRHENTRHNIGFEVIDELARLQHSGFSSGKGKFVYAKIMEGNEPVILLKPMTYMNLSGHAVIAAMSFYKIHYRDLLVICDDLNIPLGSIRLRAKGSAGGQNGLNHIIQCLGRNDFARLRVGIGPDHPVGSYSSFVLGTFNAREREQTDRVIPLSAEAALDFVSHGIEHAMNHFNTGKQK
ncbi:aminoacyl-tRNA hydrolase [Prosthecochloris sp. N3]|uniref:Peptidyl-tRNA hydrolase n=1 Tax=Prosthecochloris ethylica TaxID=2743976 RepID=A0ABR9XQE5_9CHLB|nr:aminoacyl-tRNA hydrolase [Prosthecochloris ethylica]MBF0585413.1 aminoacyl-tRNA hydrolase [Prosthecochloris ethylica]MBF0636199.1 aminoacyl-tRNA hydrolase [Prosthecochloris ethylica]NUK46643.1 aminoacyl-tRNA hydrolase [Prosthecochloris ethylica]